MAGLTRDELRFALLISSSHFAQHVYYRILPPLIPVLAVALEYPLWQLGLLITVNSLALAIAQAPLGVLADRVDRVYMLPLGIAVTGAGYLPFAFAPLFGPHLPALTLVGHTFEGSYLLMSVSMTIVGVGLAVVHPAGYPMITDNVSSENKGTVLGFFGASSKFGDGATPAVIAAMILVLTWEQIIAILGIGGIGYGVALFFALQHGEYETLPSGKRNGPESPDADPRTPLDRREFHYPMGAIFLFFATSGLTSQGLAAFLPAFLVVVYAYSFEMMGLQLGAESVANLYFALLLFAGGAIQLYFGRLTDIYDPRSILISCMGLATIGMIGLAIVDASPLLLVLMIIILGTGLYGVNPARDALISDISPPEFEGRSFGYMFTAVGLTTAIFPTLVGYLLEVIGMREGFFALAIGTILAAVSVALLYSRRVYVAQGQQYSSPAD